jgi:hypothetical protein
VATASNDTTEKIDCGCTGKTSPKDDGVLMTTTAVVLPPAANDVTESPETTSDASVKGAQAQVDAMRLIAGQGVTTQVLNQLASQSTSQALNEARTQFVPLMRQAREVSAAARELSQTLRQTVREFNGLPPANSPQAQELLKLRDEVVEKAQALNVAAPLPSAQNTGEIDAEPETPVTTTPAAPTSPTTSPAQTPPADLVSLLQALLPLLEAWLSQTNGDEDAATPSSSAGVTPTANGVGGSATPTNTPAPTQAAGDADKDDTAVKPQNSVSTPAPAPASPTDTAGATPAQPDLITSILALLQQQLNTPNPDFKTMVMLLMLLLVLPNLMPAPSGGSTTQAA